MGLVLFVAVGVGAGLVARSLAETTDLRGTLVFAILGAALGGMLGNAVVDASPTAVTARGFTFALFGMALLLMLYHFAQSARARA